MSKRAAAAVDSAVDSVRAGRMAVVIDDDGAGVLVQAAASITAEDVVAMVAGGGVLSIALTASRCAELELEPQGTVGGNRSGHRMAVSIDALEGTTTGISAEQRANTVRVAADPDCRPADLVRPGHVLPIVANDDGVLGRRGQAEAAVDLARLASGPGAPAAVCALLDEHGRVAGAPFARELAERSGLPVVELTDIASVRWQRERPLRIVGRERLVTHHGDFAAVNFLDTISAETHMALVRGAVEGRERVPVWLHRASPGDDLLAGLARDRVDSLALALRRFARAEMGVVVYLAHRSPTDPQGLDIARQVLGDLGPASVVILNPEPALEQGLADRGVIVVGAEARAGGGPGRRADRERSPSLPSMSALDVDMAI